MTEKQAEGYAVYKDVSAPGVGQLAVMRNTRGEFVLRKTLTGAQNKQLDRIEKRARRLMVPGFQQMLPFQASATEVYFEFSRKNLEDHLHSCLQKDMMVSEDDLRSLLRSLAECGVIMEKLDEYHPSLTLQNIFRMQDKFKLINPYVFDSYTEQMAVQNGQSKPNDKLRAEVKSKQKVNLIQTGAAILCIGVLVSERELKAAQTYGRLAKLLLQFQERYSARFSNLVEDIIYGRLSSFTELNDKLEPGHEKRESIGSAIGISPPIDFETDLYASMAEGYARGKSREKTSGIVENKKMSAQAGYKRFLGADGAAVDRVKVADVKPHIETDKTFDSRRLGDDTSYRVANKQIENTHGNERFETRGSRVRADFVQDEMLPKERVRGSDRESEVRTNSSVQGKQKDSLAVSKTPQKKIDVNREKPLQFKNEEERHTPTNYHLDRGLNTQTYSRTPMRGSKVNRFELNNSEVNDEVVKSSMTKASSAQDFYPKTTVGTEGPLADKNKRVSAIYNRLNERFKQYQKIDSCAEPKQIVQPVIEDQISNRVKLQERARNEPTAKLQDPLRQRSRHPEDGAYSPFDLSNTKKQIKDEREKQYSSLYLSRDKPVEIQKEQPPQIKQSRLDSLRPSHESPRLEYDFKKNSEFRSRDSSRLDHFDKRRDYHTVNYEEKAREAVPERSRQYHTYEDESDQDRRRNRSVSFNLANTSYDLGRSYAHRKREPKSILKKSGGEDLYGSAGKSRNLNFESESNFHPSKYHPNEDYHKYEDFRIDTRYMGKQPRHSENYGKLSRGYDSRLQTEPYSTAFHGHRSRVDRHYS